MGGSGGGSLPSSDLGRLEQHAKESLKAGSAGESHVFISFAVEDEAEVNLLRGQAKNEKTELDFDDFSLKDAIKSKNDDYIKQRIRERIDRASVTLVYLTPDSAKSKWVDWEISESLKRGKSVLGVHKGDTAPAILPTSFLENKLKVVKWSHDEIMKAIEIAKRKR